ncbi:MAG TPA: glycine--tRNA ligase subunit beta [Candidatus Saccharimonadales bacterium]|nr:glycine--tRNA ligase subunit beta [Candidatus Saccharimonadales bacterium]
MNFLLEIGVEELPAGYARRAWQELVGSRLLAEALGGPGAFQPLGSDRLLYTPRRLAFLAAGVPEKHPDQVLDVTGPARQAAFDAQGQPTRALQGFLKAQGVALDQVGFVQTAKGEYVRVRVTRPGAPVREALQKAIPEAIAALPFPKTMRWEPGGARFARPIRWIVAMLDGRPLEVRFADVASGTRSAGHRFLHPGFFDLKGLGHGQGGEALLSGYLAALRERGVLVSGAERRREIVAGLRRLAGSAGGRQLEDPELVEITADLVEWPAVVCGGFDPAYLDLPREVIVTAMREHQRYFAVEDPAGGLLPSFLCVANATKAYLEERRRAGTAGLASGLRVIMESAEPGAAADVQLRRHQEREDQQRALDEVLAPVARGNERVLKARLDDARFYWETDLGRWRSGAARPPQEQAEPLKGIVWLEGWGTVYEKAARVSRLVRAVGPELGVPAERVEALQRAAWLMKLDLTAEMIKDGKEFTSLEGRMGALYAERCGEGEAVTVPMSEHYLPRESVTEEADRRALVSGAAAAAEAEVRRKLPRTREARALALLDKLDSVAGFFAAGRIPSGSEDPFGVRRAGSGLVALLLFDHLALRREQVQEALRGYGDRVSSERIPEVYRQLFEFLLTRLRAFLADCATEAVNAALGAGQLAAGEVFDPLDAAARAAVMHDLLGGAEAPAREELFALSTLFKRVSNILKECQLDDREPGRAEFEPAERKLLDALETVSPRVLECYRGRRYDAALGELLHLRAPIDQFFLDVLVMAEEPAARERRLKLLRRTQGLLLGGWDFSQVSVPASAA